jgi:hypothetical protein
VKPEARQSWPSPVQFGALAQKLARSSKSSAQNNKSRDVGKATNKWRSLPAVQQFGLRDFIAEY